MTTETPIFLRGEVRSAPRYLPPITSATTTNLCLNEHFVTPSPRVAEALRSADPNKLVAYDLDVARKLRETIAAHEGVAAENVALFSGESQALEVVFGALSPGRVALPSIGWSYYENLAALGGFPVTRYAITREVRDGTGVFATDVSAAALAASGGDCSLLVFINPHMPTGHVTDRELLLSAARRNRGTLVLVDQAYEGFSEAAPSVTRDVLTEPNLVVAKTLSKYHGLASLRVGYLIAHASVIEQLQKTMSPFAIPYLSSLLATAAIEDSGYYRESAHALMASKAAFEARFRAPGMPRIYESHANFLLVELEGGEPQAREVEQALRDDGIIVRSAKAYGLPEFLRISVGPSDVMQRVADIVEERVTRVHERVAEAPDSGVRERPAPASGVRLVGDGCAGAGAGALPAGSDLDYAFVLAMSPNYKRMGTAFLNSLNHFEPGREIRLFTLDADLAEMRAWAKGFRDVTVLPYRNTRSFTFGDWHPLVWAKLEAFAMTDHAYNVVLDVDQILYRDVGEHVRLAKDAGKVFSGSIDMTSLHGHMHPSRMGSPMLAALPETTCLNAGAMIVRPCIQAYREIVDMAIEHHEHMWLPEQGILNVWAHLAGEAHDVGDGWMLDPWNPKVLEADAPASLIHFWTPRPAFFGDSPLRANEPAWDECLAAFERRTNAAYPYARFEQDFELRLRNFANARRPHRASPGMLLPSPRLAA